MIDWIKTKKETGFDKEYFDKYPCSDRLVWRICDNCNRSNWVKYGAYYDICHWCATHNEEYREKQRKSANKRWEDPKQCENAKEKAIKQFEDPEQHEKQRVAANKRWEDPEQHEKASKGQKKRFSDPNERKKDSENIKNSIKHKESVKNRKYKPKLCEICNEEFIPNSSGHKYCEECTDIIMYCWKFNEKCRENNREKYDRECYMCGLLEEENIDKNGDQRKLSVHHADMDKMQGCDDIKWKLVPVCMDCHGKLHSNLWIARITWLLKHGY